MPITVTHDLKHEISDFLIREAWLLDDRRFHEWFDPFTEDVFYWMPSGCHRGPIGFGRTWTTK
jgi:3-phenylpropionate/cinnamic acid dioxygenase small subunit